MENKNKQTAIANKIKKWLETAKELRTEKTRLAIPITRLTSIKSLCEDEIAAQKFALYIARRVQQQMNDISCPEWETDKKVVADAITQMERCVESSTPESRLAIENLLREIDRLQGDDYRYVYGKKMHFVRSGALLKIDYALRCFREGDFPYWAYKLAREYAERYEPQYGTGLIPESAPMLLEIAQFWCQYYFGQHLSEKFPKLMEDSA
jgi:hypothetical protein